MDDDEAEQEVVIQFHVIEGGDDLIDALVNESFIDAQSHVVDATIDLYNKETYLAILEEETKD